ncbi:glycosyltransferase family 2 protein [Halovivax cerinus]|uniref:Glycosyltransferase family 2 protein n=1 Tax=Halovivax cerinus TaxID=1487865 RepID=A0ABD5NK71_9EURY|nr:glycosyltransferase [Halovivax cerinus]
MKLSVVVSTLNDRERLCDSLDALTADLSGDAEVLVVNGPSTDGTTGAVRDRDDVDVLVEISERSASVSRNAGLDHADGDVVAFLADGSVVTSGWAAGIRTAIDAGADVVTGPVTGRSHPGDSNDGITVAGRSVTPVPETNVAFTVDVVETLDGFDEYLDHGSAVDCAHRIAGAGFDVTWSGDMTTRWNGDPSDEADEWGVRYRSIGYRLAKNYGLRPSVLGRTVGRAALDGFEDARCVLRGETALTRWIRNGSDVTTNALYGIRDGLRARHDEDRRRLNPNGVSSRHDRAVQVYDRR